MTHNISSYRYINFDALKSVSMFMIVIWHFYIHGMQVDNSFEIDFGIIGFINCFLSQYLLIVCSVCVNVYVLITGYFLVSKSFSITRIIRVWIASVFYGALLTTIIYFFSPGINTPKDIVDSFFPVCSNSYWFVRQYIGLMIISPFISLAARSMRKDIYELLLLALIILGTTFIMDYPFGEAMRMMRGYSFAWFVCLFMFGGYIRRFGFFINRGKAMHLFFALSLFLWLYSIVKIVLKYFYFHTPPMIIEYSYNGIPFFLALLLFCWFGQIEIKNYNFTSMCICKISSLVFGVYLIHDNLSVRELLWKRCYQWTDLYDSIWLIPIAIVSSIIIFILCIIFEAFRKNLFYLCGIDHVTTVVSQKVDELIIRYRKKYLFPLKR